MHALHRAKHIHISDSECTRACVYDRTCVYILFKTYIIQSRFSSCATRHRCRRPLSSRPSSAHREQCVHIHTHTRVHNPHHHQQRRHRPTLATHILGSACCTQSSVDEDTSAAASRLPTQTQTPGTRGHAYIINNMHDVHTHTHTHPHAQIRTQFLGVVFGCVCECVYVCMFLSGSHISQCEIPMRLTPGALRCVTICPYTLAHTSSVRVCAPACGYVKIYYIIKHRAPTHSPARPGRTHAHS